MANKVEQEIQALKDAVDLFAHHMKQRLVEQARKGYTGWNDPEYAPMIKDALANDVAVVKGREHPIDGKEIDIANRAMMLWFLRGNGAPIEPEPKESDPLPTVPCLDCGTPLLLNDLRIWGGKGPYCQDCHKTVQTMSLRPTATRR